LAVGILLVSRGSATSPLIVDDPIVGLAQPLAEALNQLASGSRRAGDLRFSLGHPDPWSETAIIISAYEKIPYAVEQGINWAVSGN
jgi:hypothetical protein